MFQIKWTRQALLSFADTLKYWIAHNSSQTYSKKLRKEVETQREVLNNLPTKKDLQIEGLKSEKRMIQATDRKILDVQRQTEIDKEIDKLNGK